MLCSNKLWPITADSGSVQFTLLNSMTLSSYFIELARGTANAEIQSHSPENSKRPRFLPCKSEGSQIHDSSSSESFAFMILPCRFFFPTGELALTAILPCSRTGLYRLKTSPCRLLLSHGFPELALAVFLLSHGFPELVLAVFYCPMASQS